MEDEPYYTIPFETPTAAFGKCWQAAGLHINTKLKAADRSWPFGPYFVWHKANLNPPFLEHLSFRLGNQLFFVRIEDTDGRVVGPGTEGGLLRVAQGQGGHACILPMRMAPEGWKPALNGWSLIDPHSKVAIDPPHLVTSEAITMTDWEVHDFAVDIVCAKLVADGLTIVSTERDPEIYPSIWFRDANLAPSWVLVQAVRYPMDARQLPPPPNWVKVGHWCAQVAPRMAMVPPVQVGTRGYFAPLTIARSDETFGGDPKPLLRGHSMMNNFQGLSGCYTDLFVLTNTRH